LLLIFNLPEKTPIMINKTGRNDPCPCGSGKKYKQCCLTKTQETSATKKAHEGAIERAVEWLMSRHKPAVTQAISEMIFADFSDDEQDALNSLDDQIWQSIQLNATECLIAEGEILVKDEYRRVTDLLLGFGGPLFTAGQRQWIEQMSDRPLRMYDITDVTPGQQITLCDALDTNALPIIVHEKSGSQSSLLGTQIGVRIMRVDDHYELSGSAYPYSRLASTEVMSALKEAENDLLDEPEELAGFISFIIRRKWIEQYIRPIQMPTFVDTQTGEPILLVSDHYLVKDWDSLTDAISGKKDVEGDATSGWTRLKECKDGLMRPLTTVNISAGKDKLEVFHNTQKKADTGRKWFEKLAGNSVEFTAREVSDPKGMMNNMPSSKAPTSIPSQPELPPDVLADVIEQAIHRMYANWSDEAIPALDGKSPKQAMATPAGMERVKGLIRSYEAGELKQAEEQQRRVISYAFLWNAVGLTEHL
jgi:hypothetical protein